MRLKCIASVVALIGLATLSPAGAQDTAPPADGAAATGAQETPKAAPPLVLTAGLGWGTWGLDGNETRFRQYATPPRGLFVPELIYAPLASPNGYQVLAAAKGLPLDDHYLEGSVDFLWGTSRIEAWRQRNEYYDLTPFVIDKSTRQWSNVAFRQILGLDWMLSLNHRMDEHSWALSLPSTELHQRARYNSVTLSGPLGPGYLNVFATSWRYTDRTLVLPNSDVSRISAAYRWQVSPRVGIEGAFQRAEVRRADMPTARLDTVRLDGDIAAGPATGIDFTLLRDNVDLPGVQSATVNEHRLGAARLTHRWRGWTAQVGARQREAQRTRQDRTYVDVPRWSTVDARVTGRIAQNVRVILRGAQEHMTSQPPMNTSDPRPLYWSDRVTATASVHAGWPTVSAYLTGSFRQYKNDTRATRVTNRAALLGGNWDVAPRLSLFAEYGIDRWSARSHITAWPTIDNFMPDARTSAIGLNWAADARTQVYANYTDYVTNNDNPLRLRDANIRGKFLSLSVRRQLGAGSQVGLVFAPWTYRDRITPQMDYETSVVMLTGSGRF